MEPGVNRPLKPSDNKSDNQSRTDYRNQINKVANAVKELIEGITKAEKRPPEKGNSFVSPSNPVKISNL